MSIIQTTQPTLTTEQKQQQAALRIQNEATILFQRMGQTHSQIMQIVFQNQQGLTPQQVLDAVGTNAAELLTLAGSLVTLVNTAVPSTLPTTFPYALTANGDGTVTVGSPT